MGPDSVIIRHTSAGHQELRRSGTQTVNMVWYREIPMLFTASDIRNLLVAALMVAALSGCGGTKVLKEPQPLAVDEALAAASDGDLSATLDWVIVRDGPGTWAKNADWDEYLVTLRNDSTGPVSVSAITVTDSSGHRHSAIPSRKKLVKASRATAKRYKGEGIKVKAGLGGGALVVAGGLSASVGAGAGAAAVYGSGAAVGATAGALVLAPVLVVGGVVKGVNNSKVNGEIERRQTSLPLQIDPGAAQSFDIFFPIAPSPLELRIDYTDASGERTIVVDTRDALDGLHLAQEQD